MEPVDFAREYVEPAIRLWSERPNNPVLAVCAIAQIDILAEVVAIAQAGGALPRRGAASYRDELGLREPAIARIRDAHDSHKHGRLQRSSASEITQGQRPRRSAGTAFFAGHSRVGSVLGRTSTAILLDDGTPVDIAVLIREAMAAWDRELRCLGYHPSDVE